VLRAVVLDHLPELVVRDGPTLRPPADARNGVALSRRTQANADVGQFDQLRSVRRL
jgi:hypothetical protein